MFNENMYEEVDDLDIEDPFIIPPTPPSSIVVCNKRPIEEESDEDKSDEEHTSKRPRYEDESSSTQDSYEDPFEDLEMDEEVRIAYQELLTFSLHNWSKNAGG